MLSIAKVARGRQDYYLATVPTGRGHDHGLVEADGRWAGGASGTLGLAGVVDPAALGKLLSGADPFTGEVLSPSHRRVKVVAYDCTFSSPKSVSVLHALGPDAAVAAVREAHSAAVDAALDYLERTSARVRRQAGGAAGRRTLPGEGLAAAAFLHRSSRAPDPHLHTHLLVVNCVPGSDGRWSALDAREMFVQAATVSHCYEAQLRREVGVRLGLRFGPMRGCSADLEGFDRALLSGFSRRSAEIAERLESRGWSGPRARRIAALATRLPKDLSVSYEALLGTWWERALGFGMAAGHLDRLVSAGRARIEAGWAPAAPLAPAPAAPGEVERLVGPTGLTRRAGSFSRGDVMRAVCREAGEGASIEEIELRADAVIASPCVLPRRAEASRLRLGAGRSFPASSATQLYTTSEILALEERLVEHGIRAEAAGLALAPAVHVAATLGARRQLGPIGASTVERLTTTGRGVEVVVLERLGAAAVVPTDAVEAAGAAWRASGIPVAGVAPSLRAARRWEAVSGIETVPLDALARDADALRRAPGARCGGVLVVGGAERIDPRRLCAILDGACEGGTKVVLVADHLPSGPDAGPLARLGRAAGAGDGAVRQRWEPPVELAGGGSSWVDAAGMRVGVAASAETARGLALEECRRRRTAGEDVVLVAPDRATARAFHAAGIPTVLPREVGPQLEARPGAALVMIGGAGALASDVRRRAGVMRAHVIVTDTAGGLEGRAAEAALPPRLVREIGAPPRTPEGREVWRRAAALAVAPEVARRTGTDLSLVEAVRHLDRHRAVRQERGVDRSLGGR